MRCMACGEEKVLAEAMPAEDMAVPGFEYQTLECPSCNDTERRLLFTGRVIVIARPNAEAAASPSQSQQTEQNGGADTSAQPAETTYNGSGVEVTSVVREEELSAGDRVTEVFGEVTEVATLEPEASPLTQEPAACAGINIAATGWLRATDKLRSYQADLHLRAEEAKKRNRDIEFDIAWDSYPVPRQRLLASHPRNTIQSHRERLRRKRLSRASARRSQSPAPAPERDAEAIRRFNELWDSLGPSRSPQQTESSAAPAAMAALPMSFGLVKLLEAVEAAMPSLT
jgi:hypothetical protein